MSGRERERESVFNGSEGGTDETIRCPGADCEKLFECFITVPPFNEMISMLVCMLVCMSHIAIFTYYYLHGIVSI